MINYLVIGICLILLILVVYISAKPISMGIEARRDQKNQNSMDMIEHQEIDENNSQGVKLNISDEIVKLKNLKNEGVITEDEFNKAKEKLLS